MTGTRAPAAERLWRRLAVMDSGCIEWTGGTGSSGYGRIRFDGRDGYTHRLAWELTNGPIPDGMFVCHRCDNPLCCNVEHLFLGTTRDNNLDRDSKGRQQTNGNENKTHCLQGHPYDEANTHVKPNGKRSCRACGRADSARRRAAGYGEPELPAVRPEAAS